MSNNKEREQKVKDTLEMLRSYLQADGVYISLVEITDDLILKVELLGACGTCPFSLQTLKNGVEQAIRKEVPEIKEVVAINM
jgi:Fe-S cluster biogenesis protein NfuA